MFRLRPSALPGIKRHERTAADFDKHKVFARILQADAHFLAGTSFNPGGKNEVLSLSHNSESVRIAVAERRNGIYAVIGERPLALAGSRAAAVFLLSNFLIRLIKVYVLNHRAANDYAAYHTLGCLADELDIVRSRREHDRVGRAVERVVIHGFRAVRNNRNGRAREVFGNSSAYRVSRFDVVRKVYVVRAHAVGINRAAVGVYFAADRLAVRKNLDELAACGGYGELNFRSDIRASCGNTFDYYAAVGLVEGCDVREAGNDRLDRALILGERVITEHCAGKSADRETDAHFAHRRKVEVGCNFSRIRLPENVVYEHRNRIVVAHYGKAEIVGIVSLADFARLVVGRSPPRRPAVQRNSHLAAGGNADHNVEIVAPVIRSVQRNADFGGFFGDNAGRDREVFRFAEVAFHPCVAVTHARHGVFLVARHRPHAVALAVANHGGNTRFEREIRVFDRIGTYYDCRPSDFVEVVRVARSLDADFVVRPRGKGNFVSSVLVYSALERNDAAVRAERVNYRVGHVKSAFADDGNRSAYFYARVLVERNENIGIFGYVTYRVTHGRTENLGFFGKVGNRFAVDFYFFYNVVFAALDGERYFAAVFDSDFVKVNVAVAFRFRLDSAYAVTGDRSRHSLVVAVVNRVRNIGKFGVYVSRGEVKTAFAADRVVRFGKDNLAVRESVQIRARLYEREFYAVRQRFTAGKGYGRKIRRAVVSAVVIVAVERAERNYVKTRRVPLFRGNIRRESFSFAAGYVHGKTRPAVAFAVISARNFYGRFDDVVFRDYIFNVGFCIRARVNARRTRKRDFAVRFRFFDVRIRPHARFYVTVFRVAENRAVSVFIRISVAAEQIKLTRHIRQIRKRRKVAVIAAALGDRVHRIHQKVGVFRLFGKPHRSPRNKQFGRHAGRRAVEFAVYLYAVLHKPDVTGRSAVNSARVHINFADRLVGVFACEKVVKMNRAVARRSEKPVIHERGIGYFSCDVPALFADVSRHRNVFCRLVVILAEVVYERFLTGVNRFA